MNELIAARDLQRLRLEAMVMRVLDTLRETIQLHPRSAVVASTDALTVAVPNPDGGWMDVEIHDAIAANFTDASARVIAPLVEKADLLGALQPKHLAALRNLILDYIGKPGYIEEFTRIIQGDTVTIEELMLIVHATADHAELVERSQA